MPLEAASYITDLNTSNPVATDGLSQADDHMRLIKSTLKATFPNFTSAPLNSTQAQLDALTPLLTVSHGQLRGPGLPQCGQFVDFPILVNGIRFTSGGVAAGGQAAVDYLEADGSVYNFSDFPDLAAAYLGTFGGNGTTTFGVPNLKNTGRFRRSRTSTLTAGTVQANQNAAHTHTGSGTTASGGVDHTHTFSGTTSGQSSDHSHLTYGPSGSVANTGSTGGTGNVEGAPSHLTGGTSNDHTHTYSGSTSGSSTFAHTHTFSFTSDSSGGTEARPEAYVQVVCVKT